MRVERHSLPESTCLQVLACCAIAAAEADRVQWILHLFSRQDLQSPWSVWPLVKNIFLAKAMKDCDTSLQRVLAPMLMTSSGQDYLPYFKRILEVEKVREAYLTAERRGRSRGSNFAFRHWFFGVLSKEEIAHIEHLVFPHGPTAVVLPTFRDPRWRQLLEDLLCHWSSAPFRQPVDAHQFPDYYRIIANPICLGDILKRFDEGVYLAPDQILRDLQQLFLNSAMYSNPRSPVAQMSAQLQAFLSCELKHL